MADSRSEVNTTTNSDGLVVRAFASGCVNLGLTNDFIIGIHSFKGTALKALKGQCGEEAGKFTCCAAGKSTSRYFLHFGMVGR